MIIIVVMLIPLYDKTPAKPSYDLVNQSNQSGHRG